MSLSKLTEGVSDVLYRNYHRYKLTKRIESFGNLCRTDDCHERMRNYLGENLLNSPRVIDNRNLSAVVETKLNQIMTTLNTDNSNDFQRILKTFSELNRIYSKSNISCPKILYDILCYVLDSENEVKTLRLFFDILDDCVNISKSYTNVSSGGRAEGIAIEDSDYDVMTILEQVTVDERSKADDHTILIYDIENSYPGFVHLNIEESQYSNEIFHYWGEETTYGRLVSNIRFKRYFMKRYRDPDITTHGPCISTSNGTVDHLFCLRSMSWPSVARQWIHRTRLHNWPTSDVVSAVINGGILFAPIGSKFGGSNNCSHEWRVSFSISEKLLIRSFNHAQLLCYKLYKYLKKDLIKPKLRDDFLCSYFIKTTLFWMCEQYPQHMWCPENIIQCFHEFQRLLLYWVKYEFCPHYFIPENNLFQGLLSDRSKKVGLESMLSNLMSTVLSSLHYGLTFSKFNASDYSDAQTSTPFQRNMKTILTSHRYLKATLRVCTLTQTIGIIRKCIFRLLEKKLSYYVKGLYLSALCIACQTNSQLRCIEGQNNKLTYKNRKNILSHLLMGRKSDIASGWCLISSYFYNTHQFQPTIKVSELVLEKVAVESIVPMENVDYTQQYINQNVRKWDTKLSFLTLMSTFCLDFIFLHPGPAWCHGELYEKVEKIGLRMVDIPPIIYAHFVRFLNFHREGKIVQRDRVLQDIIRYVRSGQYIELPWARIISYGVLAKAFLAMGDEKAALYWTGHIHRLYEIYYNEY